MATLSDLQPIVLRGSYIYLEPLAERHAAELFAIGTEESMWTYLPSGPLLSEDDALQFIQRALARRLWKSEFPYALRLCASGALIGSMRYQDIQPVHRSVEIGWTFVHPSQWGTLAGIESHLILARYALEDLEAGRVWFKVDTRNLRTLRLLDRWGATREGVLRKHLRVREGFIRDSAIYSIIAEEWPQLKQRSEELLARLRRTPDLH